MKDIRTRLEKDDYGFRPLPIPYRAGSSQSRASAVREMERLLDVGIKKSITTDKAIVYADKKFHSENNKRFKNKYGVKKVIVMQEEGVSGEETFTYFDFGMRFALSLSIIELFDEEKKLSAHQKERIRDMITAMLGVISEDPSVVKKFEQNPENLINGVITLRPAERIVYDDLTQKLTATRRFLKSL